MTDERDRMAAELQLALDAARMGWWRYDPIRRYSWWDERYKEIFGVQGYERPNDEILARLHPDDLPAVWASVEAALNPRDPRPYAAEYRVNRPDGQVWVEAHGIATFEGEGPERRATMLVGTVADITERKRVEATLRESEARYRTLFDQASEGIAVADAETGELLDCNHAFEGLSGYARAELIGQPQKMLHPDEGHDGRVSRSFEASRADRVGGVITDRLRTRGGELRHVEIRRRMLQVGDRDVILGIFHDCTQERYARWERDLSLGLLRLFHKATDARELMREATAIVQASVGCEAVGIRLREGDDYPYYETRGFPADFVEVERSLCLRDAAGDVVRDATGSPVLECMCGNILCGRVNPELSFFTGGGSFWSNCTTELLASTTDADRQARTRNRCNGEGYESVALVPIRHGGEILGLLQLNDHRRDRFEPAMIRHLEGIAAQLGTALAQRWAQQALAERERTLRVLAGNIPGMVYSTRADWSLRYVSKCEAVCGFSADDLRSGSVRWIDLVAPDDRAHMEAEGVQLVTESASRLRTYRIVNRSGQVRWVEDHASPRHTPEGAFDGVDGVVFDVTPQRNLEAQLRQAQKMESVGRLAGGVAHDFNNLLTVIENCTSFALEAVGPAAPVRGDLEQVRDATERAASLTRQLLAFSRKQVLEPRVLQLDQVVAGIESMLRRLLGEDIAIRVYAAPDLGRVSADPGQIEQVLVNLAVNARDAMPSGGRLTIETANVEFDSNVAEQRLATQPGRFVMLSVADTGVGMSPDVRDHVFEPFFTTKPAGQGTGLGLSTVYGIVKQSGGNVWVYSEPGKGTTFKIYLPRVDAPVEAIERPLLAEPAVGHETVLVVEDEPVLLALVGRILERAGYRVLPAADPGEALQAVAANAAEIDLVLTDVVMPQMSGRQLAERIASIAPRARMLYMSGYTDNAIVHQGVLDPGTAFIGKPFSRADLVRKVRDVLAAAREP